MGYTISVVVVLVGGGLCVPLGVGVGVARLEMPIDPQLISTELKAALVSAPPKLHLAVATRVQR